MIFIKINFRSFKFIIIILNYNNILEYIRENKLEEITIKIGDGKLRLANTNVTQPLSYKFLSETLVDYFEDDGDVVSEIIEYIKENEKCLVSFMEPMDTIYENIYMSKITFIPMMLFWVIFAALSPGIAAFILYGKVQSYLGAWITGFTLYLFTVYGAIYGILLFGETLDFYHYYGAAFVFLGVYFVRKRLKKNV